jgi:hypothetical protein
MLYEAWNAHLAVIDRQTRGKPKYPNLDFIPSQLKLTEAQLEQVESYEQRLQCLLQEHLLRPEPSYEQILLRLGSTQYVSASKIEPDPWFVSQVRCLARHERSGRLLAVIRYRNKIGCENWTDLDTQDSFTFNPGFPVLISDLLFNSRNGKTTLDLFIKVAEESGLVTDRDLHRVMQQTSEAVPEDWVDVLVAKYFEDEPEHSQHPDHPAQELELSRYTRTVAEVYCQSLVFAQLTAQPYNGRFPRVDLSDSQDSLSRLRNLKTAIEGELFVDIDRQQQQQLGPNDHRMTQKFFEMFGPEIQHERNLVDEMKTSLTESIARFDRFAREGRRIVAAITYLEAVEARAKLCGKRTNESEQKMATRREKKSRITWQQ